MSNLEPTNLLDDWMFDWSLFLLKKRHSPLSYEEKWRVFVRTV